MSIRIAPLVVAIAALVAMAATYHALVVSYSGQVTDHDAMVSFGALTGHDVPTHGLLGRMQIPLLFVAAAVIAVGCLVRRSIRLFAHACLVVLGTTLIAVVLQAGLDRPTLGIGQLNSFPSKTVAAFTATGIALCAIMPRRTRPVVVPAVLAVVAAVSAGVVSLLWHRPSDVIGGVLLAVAVAALTECLLPVWGRSARRRTPTVVPDWRQPLRH